MGFITVEQFTKELARLTGEPEFRNYNSIIGHLRRGYAQINMTSMPTLRTELISIDNKHCVQWPDDCIRPLMVGVKRENCNYIINLALDSSIYLGPYGCCNNVDEADCDIASFNGVSDIGFWYWNVYDGNWVVGELYGMGQGYDCVGYVQHDKQNRLSYIKGRLSTTDKIAFSYKSSGVGCGLDIIPTEVEEALRQYIISAYYQISKPAISDRARQRYTQELTLLRKFNLDQSEEDWTQALTHNYKSSPK